jgi:hypothetical protein
VPNRAGRQLPMVPGRHLLPNKVGDRRRGFVRAGAGSACGAPQPTPHAGPATAPGTRGCGRSGPAAARHRPSGSRPAGRPAPTRPGTSALTSRLA